MPGTELVTEEKTMAITIKPEILSKFTNAIAMKAKDVAFEVLQNYPEASSEWIRCTHYAEYNIPDCKSYTLKFRTLDGIHDDENFQSREANTDDVAQAVVTTPGLEQAGGKALKAGGAEDYAQRLATKHLLRHQGLQHAVDRGAPVLAICAAMWPNGWQDGQIRPVRC